MPNWLRLQVVIATRSRFLGHFGGGERFDQVNQVNIVCFFFWAKDFTTPPNLTNSALEVGVLLELSVEQQGTCKWLVTMLR